MNIPLDVAMAELDLIPKGSLPQNIFRDTYFCLRENSLGQQPTVDGNRQAAWDAALAIVRKNWPGFVPECDPALLAST
ncbi:MAG: hypothetical protein ABSB69_14155 [Solirubrobacteraceae bacterium]